jgi:hypothetical protein
VAVSNAFVYLCLKPVCYTGDAYGQFFKAPMISENVVESGAATPAMPWDCAPLAAAVRADSGGAYMSRRLHVGASKDTRFARELSQPRAAPAAWRHGR